MENLQELPKFGDKLSYLYVEHAVVEQADKAIALHTADGTTPVPAAGLATLILGPGTKITHAAIKALADNNCLVIWAGERGVRFYAQGLGGARHSRNQIRQAQLVCNEVTRLQVVVRMYCHRFNESPDPNLTLQQLRGKEGIRVRQAYAEASKATGVQWRGRSYKRENWHDADPANRALSAGNACLYGLTHAAILSAGYSPALGFIHTGKQLSFVYDIADLYKIQLIVPLAFRIAREQPPDLERQVRIACRQLFREQRLMERVLPDIANVLDVPTQAQDAEDDFAEDGSKPAELWRPQSIPLDMPVGRILKLDASCPGGTGGREDGSGDPGEGDTVAAG